MPELPEVETIKRVLSAYVLDRIIVKADLNKPNMLRGQSPAQFLNGLSRQKIFGLSRRGKYLLINLKQHSLIVHLGMSGQIFASPGKSPFSSLPSQLPDKHTHLVLSLSKGTNIFFRDPRMFGRYILLKKENLPGYFSNLGPDPFSLSFSSSRLEKKLSARSVSIKACLLDQKIVAGMGNIYADETLFQAGIHPAMPANQLTSEEIARIHKMIRNVLHKAVKAGGTSISDFQDPLQRAGDFQHHLLVYGRAGKQCKRCGALIQKKRIAQRGTHWCPYCQKLTEKFQL